MGVTGIPSDDAFYTTMLKTAGLTTDDVEKVNVGFNLVPSILSNKVDAIIGGYPQRGSDPDRAGIRDRTDGLPRR